MTNNGHNSSPNLELLTTEQMARADALAIAGGIPGLTLMEKAGQAVADVAVDMIDCGANIAVLCGPGNNGGDGFVAARLLAARGFNITLGLLCDLHNLKGDAATMASRWQGDSLPLDQLPLAQADLVIDALFGAGLTRPIAGTAAAAIASANDQRRQGCKILSVDVPSGVNGTTGQIDGPAITADRTVTFFRRKPGHLLQPGRGFCGNITVADIGIPAKVLDDIKPQSLANAPALWRDAWPTPQANSHKYSRGHVIAVSGPAHATGAARLAARGALRVGAGVVTLASPMDAVAVNAAHLTAIMLQPFKAPDGLAEILADKRRNAIVIGPGCGIGAPTRDMVAIALKTAAAVVLDADALTSFAEAHEAQKLFDMIAAKPSANVVLTPHEGEFSQLFGAFPTSTSKLERARQAAQRSQAIVVLKGSDSVIAAPDGWAAINANAPPRLATAGSGDVLAGFIAGAMAQGMPSFDAACASAWLHGECANLFGPGLIAEDLPEILPRILQNLA